MRLQCLKYITFTAQTQYLHYKFFLQNMCTILKEYCSDHDLKPVRVQKGLIESGLWKSTV